MHFFCLHVTLFLENLRLTSQRIYSYFDFVKFDIVLSFDNYHIITHEKKPTESPMTKGEKRMLPLRRRSPALADVFCRL